MLIMCLQQLLYSPKDLTLQKNPLKQNPTYRHDTELVNHINMESIKSLGHTFSSIFCIIRRDTIFIDIYRTGNFCKVLYNLQLYIVYKWIPMNHMKMQVYTYSRIHWQDFPPCYRQQRSANLRRSDTLEPPMGPPHGSGWDTVCLQLFHSAHCQAKSWNNFSFFLLIVFSPETISLSLPKDSLKLLDCIQRGNCTAIGYQLASKSKPSPSKAKHCLPIPLLTVLSCLFLQWSYTTSTCLSIESLSECISELVNVTKPYDSY